MNGAHTGVKCPCVQGLLSGVAAATLLWGQATASAAVIFADSTAVLSNGWVSEAFAPAPEALWHGVTNVGFSASNAWWCGPVDAVQYGVSSNTIDAGLSQTNDVVLPATPAVLTFRERYNTEWGLDDCQVWGSTNRGVAWFILTTDRWGNSEGLQHRAIALNQFTNQTFRFRFRFTTRTPHLNDYAGWYLGDIKIMAQNDDSDADGLLDYEEECLGSDPANPDVDQDGVSDGQEVYVAGTDPLDKSSVLAFSTIEPATSNTLRLAWRAAPDRVFAVASAATLTDTWQSVAGSVVTSSPDSATCALILSGTNIAQYYRVITSNSPAIPTCGFDCGPDGHAALYTNHVVCWGDLHSHTIFSNDALSNEHCTVTPYDALTGCVGRLDFVAITDHAENGVPGMYPLEKWTNTMAMEQAFQAEYTNVIVFPGFEYTHSEPANTGLPTVPDGNGHRNIILRDFEHLPERGFGQDVYTNVIDLWSYLQSSNAAGHFLCIPHHPAKGSEPGMPVFSFSMAVDWSTNYARPEFQGLVEIYSRHGSSEMSDQEEPVNNFKAISGVGATLDRWVTNHLSAYKLGIIGSTDTHMGDPGEVSEVTNNIQTRLGFYTGGLAAVLVQQCAREDIWTALKDKACYGTSGGKIKLEFTARLANTTVPMGGTLYHTRGLSSNAYAQVNLHIRAESADTNAIARIQIYRNTNLILDSTNAMWGSTVHLDTVDRLIRDFAYYRVKVWQNAVTLNTNCLYERAWSSPIWVEKY